jgi:hypothetical protein
MFTRFVYMKGLRFDMQRRETRNNDAPIENAGFGRTVVLLSALGGLVAGGCNLDEKATKPPVTDRAIPSEMASTPRDAPSRTAGADEAEDKSLSLLRPPGISGKFKMEGRISVGDEITFGLTSRGLFLIKVTGIEKENVTANITMPSTVPIPSFNLITVKYTLNDYRISHTDFGKLVKAIQRNIEQVRRDYQKQYTTPLVDESAEFDKGVKEEQAPQNLKPHKPVALEFARGVWARNGHMKYGGVTDGISNFLNIIAMTDGITNFPKTSARFRLVKVTDKELLIEVTGTDNVLKLDRRLHLEMQFIAEKAGFFRIPLWIQKYEMPSIHVSGLEAVPDYSRDVHAEGLMGRWSKEASQCPKK